MLHNLLGLTALRDGDFAAAEAHFGASDVIPDALPASHGIVALNRAFAAVAQRRPADAVAQFKEGVRLGAGVELPSYAARIAMLGGLVAWSAGDAKQAEALLRKAADSLPYSQAAHTYLAQLLASRGDATGAAAEIAVAAGSRSFNVEIPALAQSDFWVDPVNGGVKLRD